MSALLLSGSKCFTPGQLPCSVDEKCMYKFVWSVPVQLEQICQQW